MTEIVYRERTRAAAPIPEEDVGLPKNIAIYITDQNHPAQRESLPPDAVPGFVVSVWRLKGRKPVKRLEVMWNRTAAQAERIADEYVRQYAAMAACGWR